MKTEDVKKRKRKERVGKVVKISGDKMARRRKASNLIKVNDDPYLVNGHNKVIIVAKNEEQSFGSCQG